MLCKINSLHNRLRYPFHENPLNWPQMVMIFNLLRIYVIYYEHVISAKVKSIFHGCWTTTKIFCSLLGETTPSMVGTWHGKREWAVERGSQLSSFKSWLLYLQAGLPYASLASWVSASGPMKCSKTLPPHRIVLKI